MKKLLLLANLAFSFVVHAQTLTYSNFIQVVSDTSYFRVASLSTFNLTWNTTTGHGVTWNAATLVPDPTYPLFISPITTHPLPPTDIYTL